MGSCGGVIREDCGGGIGRDSGGCHQQENDIITHATPSRCRYFACAVYQDITKLLLHHGQHKIGRDKNGNEYGGSDYLDEDVLGDD